MTITYKRPKGEYTGYGTLQPIKDSMCAVCWNMGGIWIFEAKGQVIQLDMKQFQTPAALASKLGSFFLKD